MPLQRTGDQQKIQIPTDVANATTINFKDEADMLLHFPATWAADTIAWWSLHHSANEWVRIFDPSGNASDQVANPSSAIQAPPAVFAAHKVRLTCGLPANAAIDVQVTSKA